MHWLLLVVTGLLGHAPEVCLLMVVMERFLRAAAPSRGLAGVARVVLATDRAAVGRERKDCILTLIELWIVWKISEREKTERRMTGSIFTGWSVG